MRALLIKDLYSLKATMKMLGAFFILMIVVTFINKDPGFMGSYTVLLSAMLPVTCIGLDERAKWDRYALTLSFSRRDLALSKYLLGLLLVGCTTVLTVGLVAGSGGWNGQESLVQAVVFGVLGLLVLAVTLPLSLHFGVEKGRIMLLILIAALMGGAMALSQMAVFERFLLMIKSGAFLLLTALTALALYALSAAIAMRIYKNKEFS